MDSEGISVNSPVFDDLSRVLLEDILDNSDTDSVFGRAIERAIERIRAESVHGDPSAAVARFNAGL